MSLLKRAVGGALSHLSGRPSSSKLVANAAAAVRFQSGAGRGNSTPKSSADKDFQLDDLLSDSDKEASKVAPPLNRRQNVGAAASAASNAAGAASSKASGAGGPVDDLASETDPAMRKAREEARAAIAAAKRRFEAAQAAAAAEQMPAIVDEQGSVLPLNSDDEGALPDIPADAITPEDARRATKQFAYHARHMRSTADEPADLELYSAALEAEFGSELEMGDPWTSTLRPNDYAPGADPLLDSPAGLPFDATAVGFRSNMTWNAAPGASKIDRRVVLFCRVAQLELEPATAQYVRAIADGHYNPATDLLKISVDWHQDAALNKREALEQLVGLVTSAGQLARQFGPFKPKKRFPAYNY